MGHQVISCDNCGSWIMEGRNEWHCDNCGWDFPPKIKVEDGIQKDNEDKTASKKTMRTRMKNLKATVADKSEFCIRDIQLFNELTGNTFEKRSLSDASVVMQVSLIEEEYLELQDALDENNLVEVLDSLADITVVSLGMLHKLGIDPVEAMKEVNKSNLSKFCKTEEEADKSVEKYKRASRYSDVHHSKEGDWWVIYGRKADTEGWKVLKGVNYKEPDFSQIMEG